MMVMHKRIAPRIYARAIRKPPRTNHKMLRMNDMISSYINSSGFVDVTQQDRMISPCDGYGILGSLIQPFTSKPRKQQALNPILVVDSTTASGRAVAILRIR